MFRLRLRLFRAHGSVLYVFFLVSPPPSAGRVRCLTLSVAILIRSEEMGG